MRDFAFTRNTFTFPHKIFLPSLAKSQTFFERTQRLLGKANSLRPNAKHLLSNAI